jgi:hypothetical protein
MDLVLRYIITIIASPTLTSAAATIIIKNTKICASIADAALVTPSDKCIFENATRSRLTEFSINSIHINIMIELRLISAPTMPIQNNVRDNIRYHFISMLY